MSEKPVYRSPRLRQEKSGEETSSPLPIFPEGGGTSVHRLMSQRLERATILGKIVDGKFVSPYPHPESRIGKWCVLAFARLHLWLGGGWGFAVPFYSVQDCSKSRTHTIPLATQASIPTPFICRVHPAGVTRGNVYTQRLHFSFSFSAR